MGYLRDLPAQTDLWDVIRAREATWDFMLDASERIMFGDSPLSRAERELIGTYVSSLNACDYCAGAHEAKARALGLSDEVTLVLLQDPASAPIDERLKPVLALARKITLEPGKVVAGDLEDLRAVGWDEDAISSVIAVVAWFSFLNRVVLAHGCELRNDILAAFPGDSEHSPRAGYQAYLESLAGDI
jgi:uncharacterized peroxidase-related enzyme